MSKCSTENCPIDVEYTIEIRARDSDGNAVSELKSFDFCEKHAQEQYAAIKAMEGVREESIEDDA